MKESSEKNSCKLCRREGKKLFLKGERCFSVKCAIVKRNYPPGVHGPKKKPRLTPFGIQLREKQKAKRFYGLREKQFQNYFQKAVQKTGDTGEIFLSLLERRLDNVVYRLGLAKSRKHARQLVSHGHFLVSGKKVDIASYQVRPSEIISINDHSKNDVFFLSLKEQDGSKEQLVGWLSLDWKNQDGKVIGLPKIGDFEHLDFDVKQIVEYYSK